MSLYWPRTPDDLVLDEPRLHALVVGVGDYPHLGGGSGPPAPKLLELQQLTTTPLTARRIARWLVESYKNPDCPLGSVELLLAPEGDVPHPDGTDVAVERATKQALVDATLRWFDRCATSGKNIALFYFAGHGISKGASQFLLPADFGRSHAALWANSIDFDGLKLGMRKNTADTQLFFVDACREYPATVLTDLNPVGDAIVTGATIHDLVATEGTYRAAGIGRRAYGPEDDITFFARALLSALDGVGARNLDGRAQVDTDSLSGSLGPLMDELGDEHAEALSCMCTSERLQPSVIHRPTSLLVRTSISCTSPHANQDAAFQLLRGGATHLSARGEPRPWIRLLPPGDWTVEATFPNAPPVSRVETLSPPTRRIKL